MKYVIDSSVAFMWVVAEPDSPKAETLRDGFLKGVHDLHAPDLLPAELANALLVAERRGRIPKGTYPRLLADALSTPPLLHLSSPLLPRVTVITSALPISVYDCLYVALAEQLGCQLVTADSRLVRNLQRQFPFVVELSSLP